MKKDFDVITTYINGYGIIDNYADDRALICYQAADENFKLNADLTYITNTYTPVIKEFHQWPHLAFILHDDHSFFQKELAINHGFYLAEKLEGKGNCRIYFFSSSHYAIYDKLVNGLKKEQDFIADFKEQNSEVITLFDNIKASSEQQQAKYFKQPNNFQHQSEKSQLLALLKHMDLLNEDIHLTDDEWKLLELYHFAQTYDFNVNEILQMLSANTQGIDQGIDQLKTKLLKDYSCV